MLKQIKDIIRGMPIVGPVGQEAARWYRAWQVRAVSRQETFAAIWRRNGWNGMESVSGAGSDLAQTQRLIVHLPALLREFRVSTILDIPCGDFFWMRHVDLTEIRYTGGDLVPDIIERNQAYQSPTVRFEVMDLLTSPLPRVDVILCRDCLVHFSNRDVFRALDNMIRSGSTFLLTTTFRQHATNRNICTGEWRPLNLQRRPYAFPPPLRFIEEGCTEAPEFADKSLGLWRISDLQSCLAGGGWRPFRQLSRT